MGTPSGAFIEVAIPHRNAPGELQGRFRAHCSTTHLTEKSLWEVTQGQGQVYLVFPYLDIVRIGPSSSKESSRKYSVSPLWHGFILLLTRRTLFCEALP